MADRFACGVENFRAVAGRRTLDQQADANAGKIAGELLENSSGAREIGGFAAPLANGKIEPGLGWRDGLVEVVAIERQAGLKTKAVTGAEADRLDARIG